MPLICAILTYPANQADSCACVLRRSTTSIVGTGEDNDNREDIAKLLPYTPAWILFCPKGIAFPCMICCRRGGGGDGEPSDNDSFCIMDHLEEPMSEHFPAEAVGNEEDSSLSCAGDDISTSNGVVKLQIVNSDQSQDKHVEPASTDTPVVP
ncbi:unnamed protein product [Dibothriocephalus latus]|uniref:Uncharacterized protein n=1 Tax=Dibothriocephalus latus TaxID=60516 RepID=A0A3P7PF73_DIBLA|nr:unnamed protein product [Dibothriocephalus latus]